MLRLLRRSEDESMKIKELRELSKEELLARRYELRKDAFNLRLQQQTGATEKPSVIRINRREVARIETILTERSKKAGA
jgi:large subunit ribosomal protein L29